MEKDCSIYNRICIDCGECDYCDLIASKKCNNCGKCIDEDSDFRTMNIDEYFQLSNEKEESKKPRR